MKETVMKNPAVAPQDKLNEFTTRVMQCCLAAWDGRENIYVKLRDGTFVRPVYQPAEDETCEAVFVYKNADRLYYWNLDGTSFTRPAYDMMEIV
jgi:hypothetical protein